MRKQKSGFTIIDKGIMQKLGLRYSHKCGIFFEIYSYTHKSHDTWYELGRLGLMNAINNTNRNTLDNNLDKKLIPEGFIISKTENGKTFYRINPEKLVELGAWDEEDIAEYYGLPKIPEQSHHVYTKPEPEKIQPEYKPELKQIQPEPKHEPKWIQPEPEQIEVEPINNYGKFCNVRLTENEYNELSEKFSGMFNFTLERFSEYMHNTKKYSTHKNHYNDIKTWCIEDKEKAEKSAKKNHSSELKNNFSNFENNFSASSIYNKTKNKTTISSLSPQGGADEEEIIEMLKEKCNYNRNRTINNDFRDCADDVIVLLAELSAKVCHCKGTNTNPSEISGKIGEISDLYGFVCNFIDYFKDCVTKSKNIGNIRAYMRAVLWNFLYNYAYFTPKYSDCSDGFNASDYDICINNFGDRIALPSEEPPSEEEKKRIKEDMFQSFKYNRNSNGFDPRKYEVFLNNF